MELHEDEAHIVHGMLRYIYTGDYDSVPIAVSQLKESGSNEVMRRTSVYCATIDEDGIS